MKGSFSTISKIKELTSIFFRHYYEKYDREKIISLLHPDIVWIGGNLQKKYAAKQDVAEYLFPGVEKSNELFKIEDQSCNITYVSDSLYLADGLIKLIKCTEKSRYYVNFSFLWTIDSECFLLIHANVYSADAEKAIYRICSQDKERFMYDAYQKSLDNSGITMLEYDVVTGKLLFFQERIKSYGLPDILENGVEELANSGKMEVCSLPGFYAMFQRIKDGEPVASCCVKERDKQGQSHYFELTLTSIYDDTGTPVRAVGVRKEVSDILLLQKEKEYGKNLAADQVLIFEADICNNTLEYVDEEWKKNIGKYIDTEYAGYQEIVRIIVEKFAAPECRNILKEKLSEDYIKRVYREGKNLISFEYRRRSLSDCYIWYKANISIIKDSITDNFNIRFYHNNIHEEKVRLLDEQKLYESLKAKAEWIYEIDFTANKMIAGHEAWSGELGIHVTDNYTCMISEFARKAVYEEDRKNFLSTLNRWKILSVYKEGKYQSVCHYRKTDKEGEYLWHSCFVHLYEEEQDGNIRGVAYVENIDDHKREELKLKYHAEHDVTTGVFNKATTEGKITECLELSEETDGFHAFIIIDIDYFKGVNDNFGHYIGDKVIKEVAERIRTLFREYDIVGRIGGDEFCVFMKDAKSQLTIEKKARELCRVLSREYRIGNITCQVSASIGISIYNKDGKTYEELYQKADSFLYKAKRNGRNQYQMQKR